MDDLQHLASRIRRMSQGGMYARGFAAVLSFLVYVVHVLGALVFLVARAVWRRLTRESAATRHRVAPLPTQETSLRSIGPLPEGSNEDSRPGRTDDVPF